MPENGKPVWISIKGVQHLDGESDTVELNTAGILERTEEGYRLTYDESVSTGMEGVVTRLSVQPGLVTLERQGAMNSLLVLQKGKRTLCNYDTGCGCLTMGVYARSIHIGLADRGGTLDFHYTLDINSDMTSSHDIYVTVREASLPN
ncbi:MAG TPA: DUF1934 domain-containing protein [Firmicutes bacterium]|nr:DUF1934 domain-containing protein [Bacillota bacterium]